MAKLFSLTTVTVVIENPTLGNITIGGAGKLLGTVGYSYDDDIFTMDSTPDGGYVSNFNGSRKGRFSIAFKQTSSHIAELTEYINKCRDNPSQAMATLRITDSLGNIAATGNGVFPSKIPDNQVTETAGNRTFDFVAGEIISEERNI